MSSNSAPESSDAKKNLDLIAEAVGVMSKDVDEMRKELFKMKQTSDAAMRCLSGEHHQTYSLVSYAPLYGWVRQFIAVDNLKISPELRRAFEFGRVLDIAYQNDTLHELLQTEETKKNIAMLKAFIDGGDYISDTFGSIYCYVTHAYSFALGL